MQNGPFWVQNLSQKWTDFGGKLFKSEAQNGPFRRPSLGASYPTLYGNLASKPAQNWSRKWTRTANFWGSEDPNSDQKGSKSMIFGFREVQNWSKWSKSMILGFLGLSRTRRNWPNLVKILDFGRFSEGPKWSKIGQNRWI